MFRNFEVPPKKKGFQDWEDLKVFLECKKQHSLSLRLSISEVFPGVVETLTLYTPDSGKTLVLIHDFYSYGLDPFGDLGFQERYSVPDLACLKDVCLRELQVELKDFRVQRRKLPVETPSTGDSPRALERYSQGWNHLERQFQAGSLRISGLPLETT